MSFFEELPCPLWNPPAPSTFSADVHFPDLPDGDLENLHIHFPIELFCFYIHGTVQKKKEKKRQIGEGNK